MDISAEERRRAFSVWLRTGRWPTPLRSVELKFNPWHDPENGRFTFAGTGRYFGRGNHHRSSSSNVRPGSGSGRFRGDDGSFGGGGAPEAGPSLRSAGRSRRAIRLANLFANPRIRADRRPPLRSDGRRSTDGPISRRVGGASSVMDMNI